MGSPAIKAALSGAFLLSCCVMPAACHDAQGGPSRHREDAETGVWVCLFVCFKSFIALILTCVHARAYNGISIEVRGHFAGVGSVLWSRS